MVGVVGLPGPARVRLQRLDPAGDRADRQRQRAVLRLQQGPDVRRQPLGLLGEALPAQPRVGREGLRDGPLLPGQDDRVVDVVQQPGAVRLRSEDGVDGPLRADEEPGGGPVEVAGQQVAAVVLAGGAGGGRFAHVAQRAEGPAGEARGGEDDRGLGLAEQEQQDLQGRGEHHREDGQPPHRLASPTRPSSSSEATKQTRSHPPGSTP